MKTIRPIRRLIPDAPAQEGGGGRMLRGVVTSWLEYVTSIAVLILVTPHVLGVVGKAQYGLWVIIQSALGHAGLLEMGVRSAMIRFVSQAEGQGEETDLEAALSAGLAYFMGLALLIALAAGGVSLLAAQGMLGATAQGLWPVIAVLGLAAGIHLFSSVFRGLLYAREHISEANLAGALSGLLKGGLVLGTFTPGDGLLALAAIELMAHSLRLVLMAGLAVRVYQGLPFRLASITRTIFSRMFRYGFYTVVNNIGAEIGQRTPPLAIAALLAAAQVPLFSIAASIVSYAGGLVMQVSNVLTPRLSRMTSAMEMDESRDLLRTATRFTLLLASALGVGLIAGGDAFIQRWLGSGFAESYPVLVALVVGMVPLVGQAPGMAYFLGTGTHHRPAWVNLAGGLTTVLTSALGAWAGGVLGAAIGVLLVRASLNLLVIPFLICRTSGLDLRAYWRDLSLGMGLFGAMALGFGFLGQWLAPSNYPGIIGFSGMCTATYLVVGYLLYLSPEERKQAFKTVRASLQPAAEAGQ